MHVLIIQYSGDYRQAVNNLASGMKETYYAQQYSVDSVSSLSAYAEQVTVLCCITEESYCELLPNGVKAIGAGFKEKVDFKEIIRLIEQQKPTHLIIRIPNPEIFQWAIRNQVKAIALFAESIITQGLRNQIKNYFLVQSLNHKQIDWVGSYGITSSMTLQKIGVNPDKIIPWDFLLEPTPGSLLPKALQRQTDWVLLYVGSMLPAKGVGDILAAVAQLKAKKISVRLQLVGRDTAHIFARQAEALGISDQVEFLGIIPNQSIEPLMREADVVVVPSQHKYPEGFPLVIHHALRSRTPIVASDHPMFRNSLSHRSSAMIFPAGSSKALASCVEQLLFDKDLYYSISSRSYETWQKLRLPVKWADILDRWLSHSAEDQRWLFNYRISSGCYKENVITPLAMNRFLQA
ncbi:MAG TPA: glycosyltransferase family 4 protein [Coleofasciculaceae cyanobacterium]